MIKQTVFMVMATVVACAPAMAQIYKCPDASGRAVIQQMPCTNGKKLEVKPASGQAQAPVLAPASAASDAKKPMTEAERLNALTEESARERRRMSLEERAVPGAWADIENHRGACDRMQAKLRAEQYKYEQNLYGKTHAAQMASEMAASAAQCDIRDRELNATFKRTVEACKKVGGCAAVAP